MSDVRGFKPGVLTRSSRYDYNSFAVVGQQDDNIVKMAACRVYLRHLRTTRMMVLLWSVDNSLVNASEGAAVGGTDKQTRPQIVMIYFRVISVI